MKHDLPRERFLKFGAGFVATALAGCGGGGVSIPATANESSSAFPSPSPSPIASSSPQTNSTITIERGQTAGAVSPTLVGLSYEKADMNMPLLTPANAMLIGCFKRLGPTVLRIGGNTADILQWTPTGRGQTSGQVAPSDLMALAAFVKATGWSVIYGINLATNTPANAAAEALYAANAFGPSLLGFEIGNECDLYNNNGLRPATYNVTDFINEWSSYMAAVRANVPSASFTGPASALHESTWTVAFSQAEISQLAVVTQHYYRAGGNASNPTASIATLLSGDPELATELQSLESISAAAPFGYRLGECNTFNGGGIPGASNAYASALWAADFLMICAQNGAAGVNLHAGEYNPVYAPIYAVDETVVGIAPEYYGMLFATQIAPGPMYPVTIAGPANATAYAVAGNDGATYLAIINKDAATPCAAAIAVGANVSTAKALVLSGQGLAATAGTQLGGATVGLDGSWAPTAVQTIAVGGSSMNYTVPPATAALLKLV